MDHGRMNEAEFRRVNRQLDRLDDRVRKVIARRKPLRLDEIPQRRPVRLARPPAVDYRVDPSGPQVAPRFSPQNEYRGEYRGVASGQLEGHEMPFYEPPACREEAPGFDYTRDVIFAEFNR